MSPISIDITHHLSPHARTPRVAQRSAYSASASRVASGIAPREWETRYFVLSLHQAVAPGYGATDIVESVCTS